MFTHTWHNLLNLKDFNTLNIQVAAHLLHINFTDIIIVVQEDKTGHLINCLQAENFTCFQNIDLILFLAKHSQNKKYRNNLIQHKNIFNVQKDKKNIPSPGILYYCKKMPAIILANQYIPLEIVNRVKIIVHSIFPFSQGICFLIWIRFK